MGMSLATFDTKMYHDQESCKEPLFCEGGVDDEEHVDPIPLEDKAREDFIQKVYGMFGIQLLPQLIIVYLISNAAIQCKVDAKDDKAVEQCLKTDGLHQFYLNHKLLWINIVLTICAVAVVVCKKINAEAMDN